MAAERGEREIFELLKEAGAFADQKDFNGNGILSLSLLNGHICIAQSLGCEPLPTLPNQKRRNKWHADRISRIRKRVMENDRKILMESVQNISESFKPLHNVYTFADGGEEVFHSEFLRIIDFIENENFDEAKSLITEAVPSVFFFPVFNDAFCEKMLLELQHCAQQSEELDLPVRKANVRNSRGVVMNDFGFQNSLYAFMQKCIQPLSNLLLLPESGERWEFKSNYSFSVEFEMGEDTDLVLHKDSSDITLNICLGTQFEGAEVYFYDPEITDPATVNDSTEAHECSFKIGYGMLHRGKQLHGTRKLTSGHRMNIVSWSRCWKNPTIDI